MIESFKSDVFIPGASRAVDPDCLFPFYPLVPKGVDENLAFREVLIRLGASDGVERELIFEACRRDLLFFVNAFLWIKQESPVPKDLPFITWPKQDDYLTCATALRLAVERDGTGEVRGDFLTDKPREIGATWLNEAEGFHIIRFTKGSTCLMGSRVEYDVDKRGASKTLFWKLDYFAEHLPEWFMPDLYWSGRDGYPYASLRFRTHLKMAIPGFGTMLGCPTHENFGRSGRYHWMLPDEFAFVDRGQQGMGERIWSATTNTCRLRRVVSTPNGRSNKFADLRHSGSIEVFTFHWWDDPAKMVGAYPLSEPMEIGPVTLAVGDWWSPWAEATRKAYDSDSLFAQEILLSYEGVGGGFYETMLPKVRHEQVKKPVWTGNIKLVEGVSKPRVLRLVDEAPYFFESWEPFDADTLRWPTAVYVMGIDVASGSRNTEGRGASNSVISVGRIEGRSVVKVAQYMTHGLLPHLFARVVCALGWCFRSSDTTPAYAIWEQQGPGDAMGQTLMQDFGYFNVHWEEAVSGKSSLGFKMQTNRRGDGQLVGSKVNVFNEHKKWLEMGEYSEPSHQTYLEMEQYKYTEDAGAQHRKVKDSLDPSEGRANHGDSVIATVLMIWAARKLRERGGERMMAIAPPKMSIAWAQQKVKKQSANAWH